MKKRVLLKIEYDGTLYSGWQRQNNAISVQQVIEQALENCCNEKITVTGASRTDAGVHAVGQMAHFDTECSIPPDKFPFVLNTVLPCDIRVTAAKQVPQAFHARFMSCSKTYTYRILNNRHGCALTRNLFVHVPVPLDISSMQRAALSLLGCHDFAAFQASGGTAKTTVRTIESFNWNIAGSACPGCPQEIRNDIIEFTITGNAFLYNMVRIIAGTLIDIGHHRIEENAFDKAFSSLSRLDLGVTAPPHGLELTCVRYPDSAFDEKTYLSTDYHWFEGND